MIKKKKSKLYISIIFSLFISVHCSNNGKKNIDFKNIKTKWKGWQATFNKFLQDWKFEKYTLVPNDPFEGKEDNIFYVTDLSNKPKNINMFANKLLEKDWLDYTYKWTNIEKKIKLKDGFIITGNVVDYTDKKNKPEKSFIAVRFFKNKNILCKSSIMRNDKLLNEAIEFCKLLK